MVVMLLAGAGLGIGILIVIRSLHPARPMLVVALQQLAEPRTAGIERRDESARPLASVAKALGLQRLINPSVATDLRLLGRSPDAHLARCLLTGLLSALIAPAVVGVLALGGITTAVELPVALVLLLALAGALLPNLAIRGEAANRRRSFNHSLSAFLDLVAVNLAAGRGIEGALDTAADAGSGWAFGEIRLALYRAKVMGETPWTGLDHLGEALGVSDLQELAASVSLAGDSGAKVRTSLAAKAQALRVKSLADVEESAQAATERMSLPVILLLCGFVIFIGYPAITRVLNGI
ncbi:MAG TPA: type II secretion system F family protein [Acidimicrobiales bacterium]|jgi:Flp pilus assembly protein TadB